MEWKPTGAGASRFVRCRSLVSLIRWAMAGGPEVDWPWWRAPAGGWVRVDGYYHRSVTT